MQWWLPGAGGGEKQSYCLMDRVSDLKDEKARDLFRNSVNIVTTTELWT